MLYNKPWTGSSDECYYPVEPTDDQAIVLARALTHWCSVYPERTVREILSDILTANEASSPRMSDDEVQAIENTIEMEVA